MDSRFQFVPEGDGWLVVMDAVPQSWIDLTDPARLEFGYMQRMGHYLDNIWPEGERMRVIHVGGGGMSLARYIAATRPTSPQIVLEPNADLTASVRETLPLEPHSGIKVRAQGGQTGIAAMRNDYARVIIIDAFNDARVPAELVTREFLADTHRVLEPDGLLLFNVIDRQPFGWTARLLAGIRELFADVALSLESSTLKGRRQGNIVIAASNVALPLDVIHRKAASATFPYRVLETHETDRMIGGVLPFTTKDTERSPAVQRTIAHFE